MGLNSLNSTIIVCAILTEFLSHHFVTHNSSKDPNKILHSLVQWHICKAYLMRIDHGSIDKPKKHHDILGWEKVAAVSYSPNGYRLGGVKLRIWWLSWYAVATLELPIPSQKVTCIPLIASV